MRVRLSGGLSGPSRPRTAARGRDDPPPLVRLQIVNRVGFWIRPGAGSPGLAARRWGGIGEPAAGDPRRQGTFRLLACCAGVTDPTRVGGRVGMEASRPAAEADSDRGGETARRPVMGWDGPHSAALLIPNPSQAQAVAQLAGRSSLAHHCPLGTRLASFCVVLHRAKSGQTGFPVRGAWGFSPLPRAPSWGSIRALSAVPGLLARRGVSNRSQVRGRGDLRFFYLRYCLFCDSLVSQSDAAMLDYSPPAVGASPPGGLLFCYRKSPFPSPSYRQNKKSSQKARFSIAYSSLL